MKYMFFAATISALALFVGYLAQAGFPTIVAIGARSEQSAHARLPECGLGAGVADQSTLVPDVRAWERRETVGSRDTWFLDPAPMMGKGGY